MLSLGNYMILFSLFLTFHKLNNKLINLENNPTDILYILATSPFTAYKHILWDCESQALLWIMLYCGLWD